MVVELPDYTTATPEDLRLAVKAIGSLATYGNFINAVLAGIYAEREACSKESESVEITPGLYRVRVDYEIESLCSLEAIKAYLGLETEGIQVDSNFLNVDRNDEIKFTFIKCNVR